MRKLFIYSCTLVAYILSIYFLFVSLHFFVSGVAISCLYILLHFSFIDAKNFLSWTVFAAIMLVACMIIVFLLGDFSFYWILSIVLFHGALIISAYYGLDALTNRVFLSTWEMIHSSGYGFTVFITLCYSCFVLAIYPRFPFTCDQLQENSTRILSTVASPVVWGQETIQQVGGWIQDVSRISVRELRLVLGITDTSHEVNTVHTGAIYTWQNMLMWTGQYSSATGTANPIAESLQVYKMRLFDQVVRDNTQVNNSICSILVQEISQRYNKPTFQFSVIMLLFILLYPFLRTFVWIIEGIAWLVLKILIATGAYRFSKNVREVDDVR